MVRSNTWTIDKHVRKRVDIAGANDKCLITAVFWGSLVGDFLLVQVIDKGKKPSLPSEVRVSFRLEYYTFRKALVK